MVGVIVSIFQEDGGVWGCGRVLEVDGTERREEFGGWGRDVE